MKKSTKPCLVDVNVWIALCWAEHVHHGAARQWFHAIRAEEAAFCRYTQIAFLRLLTSERIMRDDVLTLNSAWAIYDQLCDDERVTFVPEPPHLERVFRSVTTGSLPGTKAWNDAYLAAFAITLRFAVASFDRGFSRFANLDFTPVEQ